MAQRGRIHPRVQDARTEAELSNIYDILQNLKVNSETIDQPSVSQAIGKSMKEGQLEVLNRFLNGASFGKKLIVTNEVTTGPCLYLNRTGTGGASMVLGDAVLALANSGGGDYILNVENNARLTAGGAWTNGSSVKLKTKFRSVSCQEIIEKLSRLRVREYEYKVTPGRKCLGPTAEDFNDIFGLGDDKTISPADLASVALLAVRCLLNKTETLERKVKELEQKQCRR